MDKHNDMNDSQKHVEEKKTETKECLQFGSIYMRQN